VGENLIQYPGELVGYGKMGSSSSIGAVEGVPNRSESPAPVAINKMAYEVRIKLFTGTMPSQRSGSQSNCSNPPKADEFCFGPKREAAWSEKVFEYE
jgi:hypothetical protein